MDRSDLFCIEVMQLFGKRGWLCKLFTYWHCLPIVLLLFIFILHWHLINYLMVLILNSSGSADIVSKHHTIFQSVAGLIFYYNGKCCKQPGQSPAHGEIKLSACLSTQQTILKMSIRPGINFYYGILFLLLLCVMINICSACISSYGTIFIPFALFRSCQILFYRRAQKRMHALKLDQKWKVSMIPSLDASWKMHKQILSPHVSVVPCARLMGQ